MRERNSLLILGATIATLNSDMPSDVELIKQKLDIVDFLKSHVNLLPAGKNFKGLCPFHQEKNPSFIVSSERQMWYCFGCNLGGDIIKFVMLYENLEFPEALRFLAEKAGIEITSAGQRDQRQFTVLYELNEAAQRFFANELRNNERALAYLKERGLNSDTIEEFGLGFSPGGDVLTVHLLNKGHQPEDIVRAGLMYKYKGLYRDRFGQRIVFPIVNDIGKVVGFTGRIFDSPAGGENDEVPKYVNSPETPVFNKSKILYGLHKSKPAIVKSKTAFLVEGQMDVLMAWQTGIRNVIAISGTGLTAHHLTKLRRFADTVVVSFDNDESGLKALERSLDIFSSFDFHIKAASLGAFKDPAEACVAEPDMLKKAILDAKPVLIYLFETYFAGEGATDIAVQKKIVRRLLQKIKNLTSSVEQNMWLKELARYSGVSEAALTVELEEMDDERRRILSDESETNERLSPQERIDIIARRILIISLAVEEFRSVIEDNLELFPESYQEMIVGSGNNDTAFLELESSYAVDGVDAEFLKKEFSELMRQLQIEALKRKQANLKKKIKLVGEDEQQAFDLAREFHNTASQIDKLKKQA